MVVLGAVQVEQVQPQGIAHDTEAGKTHGRSSEHWIQGPSEKRDPDTCCKGNADYIVEKCPEKILMDIPKCGAA